MPSCAFLSLNLPGEEKTPPGSACLFAWALAEITRAFPAARLHANTRDVLGHYAIITIDAPPRSVKAFAIALETRRAAARLIDLDVYAADGVQLGRRELGLPPRPCLLCDEAAMDCIRQQRHERRALVARAHELLLDQAGAESMATVHRARAGSPAREGERLAERGESGPASAFAHLTAVGPFPRTARRRGEIGVKSTPTLAAALHEVARRTEQLQDMAACLTLGARDELALTPKPGLVDRNNNGSHPDLGYACMEESIGYVGEYLDATAASLLAGAPFECQKQLAVAAEQRLYAQLHTNTHKGFIFLSGMLLIACWRAQSMEEAAVRRSLSALAAEFFRSAPRQPTHGQRAREKYRTGGIVDETLRGYPSLFDEALPAYRHARQVHGDGQTARFALLARLMQCVEDTTTLHRAGPAGLERLRHDGRQLEKIIADGGDFLARLEQLDAEYIRQNLTMGGVADMLGMTLGYLRFCELHRA